MDEIKAGQINYRNFALPLCLLSVVFFILYILGLSWLLSGTLRSGLELFFPVSTASMLAGFFPYASCGLALLLSSAGAVLLVREVQARPVPRNPAFLLCAIFGVMILCVVVSVTLPSSDIQKYAGLIVLVGYASVPLCLAFLLDRLEKQESCPSGTGTLRSCAMVVGFFGLFFVLLLVYSTLAYVPPAADPRTDNMFNFDPLALIGAFFGLIDLAFLMPGVGILLLRFSVRLQRIPPESGEPVKEPGLQPEKKTSRVFPGFHRPVTPRMWWIVVLLVLLCLAAGGYYACWMFIDTTPGKTWTKVTSSASFGSKGGFTPVEYKGKLWLIGGTGNAGSQGEAWYTSDGLRWTRESSADMVPQRRGASEVVFKDALWVIGGTTERTYTLNNDVWYSGNGMNWSQIQPAAAFSPRNGHSTTVFRDRLWLIGGNLGTETNNLTNDIWYSDDGISWQQATPTAEFSPRSGHSVFVYHDKLWVIGGWDDTGNFNDVWDSEDGIHWTQVTESAAFAKNTYYTVVIFDDRMWVIQNFYIMDPKRPWVMDYSKGIWYSTDGATWTKQLSSPEFFREEYSGQPPLPIVFDNRLWVLQEHNIETGIWYTMPSGQVSCRPTANISVNKITGPAPITVEFTDTSFCRPDVWQWDFGDGSQSAEQNPKHTFTEAGNYSVILVVKNNAGESRQSVNISVFRALPTSHPSAGKEWKRATDKPSFGIREDYSVTVWNDEMWVIGGNDLGGTPSYGDIWYSRDGSHWTQAAPDAEFGTRFRHSTAILDGKLWLIGGYTTEVNQSGEHVYTLKNDTWYSTDGRTWTQGTPAAEFPPQENHVSIGFGDRLFVVGQEKNPAREYVPDLLMWYSDDGIHWNQSAAPRLVFYSRLTPVIKDGLLWVLSGDRDLWNSPDGNTRTVASVPSCNWEGYSLYTESLAVSDNKLWLFRALEKRTYGAIDHGSMHGELWSSDDGYNWVLVTDSVPFADNVVGLNSFHLVAFDNKLWAYMDRLKYGAFSDRWDDSMEIWYSDLS